MSDKHTPATAPTLEELSARVDALTDAMAAHLAVTHLLTEAANRSLSAFATILDGASQIITASSGPSAEPQPADA